MPQAQTDVYRESQNRRTLMIGSDDTFRFFEKLAWEPIPSKIAVTVICLVF